nr:uncharacterized protein LOC116157152 [Camelus dromedarius]
MHQTERQRRTTAGTILKSGGRGLAEPGRLSQKRREASAARPSLRPAPRPPAGRPRRGPHPEGCAGRTRWPGPGAATRRTPWASPAVAAAADYSAQNALAAAVAARPAAPPPCGKDFSLACPVETVSMRGGKEREAARDSTMKRRRSQSGMFITFIFKKHIKAPVFEFCVRHKKCLEILTLRRGMLPSEDTGRVPLNIKLLSGSAGLLVPETDKQITQRRWGCCLTEAERNLLGTQKGHWGQFLGFPCLTVSQGKGKGSTTP